MIEGRRPLTPPGPAGWQLALLLTAAGLAFSGHAAADDAENRSRQLFQQAEALANNGSWNEACPLFQAANDLHGTGGTALRTADCYEKVGKYERALDLYQWIVDHRDTDPKPERVQLAMGRVAALRKQLGPTAPTQPTAPVTAPTPPPLAPTAQQGQPKPPLPPPPPPPPPSRVPVYVSYGIGGAGLVIGAIFGGLALAQAHTINSICKPNVPCPQEASAHDSALTKATVSDVGFGVAIAGAVAGTVLLFVNRTPATQSAVRSVVGPDGLSLRF